MIIKIINVLIYYVVDTARYTDHGTEQGGQGVTLLCWRWRREEGLGWYSVITSSLVVR